MHLVKKQLELATFADSCQFEKLHLGATDQSYWKTSALHLIIVKIWLYGYMDVELV